MKKVKKTLNKKLVSAIAVAAMVVQCICSPVSTQVVYAKAGSEIGGLLTEYTPEITEFTSEESGFVHPGVGLTKEMLDNVQVQVRGEVDPWKTYFEDMLTSSAASRTPSIKLTNPAGTSFNSSGVLNMLKQDALTAYTQAVLYYVTGDNVYRKNAIKILRVWSQLDPDKYAYYTDSHIQVTIPVNRICIAAEIIRCSSYEVTGEYTDEDLNWTDEEINSFIKNLIDPCIKTFLSDGNHFMNQHLYTTIGAMSGYLFKDDAAGYAKTVEWFTVNEGGENPGFNGSIKRLFRKITTLDKIGEKEGTGTPLREAGYDKDYVIQHVEMGRDQAHGCGDLTNSAILARMLQGQGTKVDPEKGTVSEAADAVNIYEFLDNRILEAADFFFQFMLGYDTEWVPVPYTIRDTDGDGEKEIVDLYCEIASEYRGRYQTMNFWDLYSYYAYDTDINLQEKYPYFYEGFMKKMPSRFIWGGSSGLSWDISDGGGDFWLFLGKEAANDSAWMGEKQVDYQVEVETRGSMVDNQAAMSLENEDGVRFVRFAESDNESKLAVHSGGVGSQTIAFRVRTDGIAKLSLGNGVSGSVYLPDTGGEWQYVTFTRQDNESFGDLYYVIISDIEGTYVDIDAIDIKPGQSNEARTIDILNFTEGNDEINIVTYANAPLSLNFSAADTTADRPVSYAGIGLPDGAVLDESAGVLTWTPASGGEYSFYIIATANKTSIVKKAVITVTGDRMAAISNAIAPYDTNAVYISDTLKNYEKVLADTRAMADTATDEEFAAQLKVLSKAVAGLELVSPVLEPDTISKGGSLDYRKMVPNNTGIHYLADSNTSFWGNGAAVNGSDGLKQYVVDFGADFKVSVEKFGYKARLGFPDRIAGVKILGSNDKVNWTLLTDDEAAYTQEYQEVSVKEEEQDNKYRYLKIWKSVNYPESLMGNPGSLLEFSEWRIWGTRYEIGNKIESISMSSQQSVSGRVKIGDTVTLEIKAKEPITDVSAVIQGKTAAITQGTEENTWIAKAVMESGCTTGDIGIIVDYKKQDGTEGDTFYETTDGSFLFLVNSDIYIDTAMLAAEMTATSGSWDKKLTPEQCAALLFDGDVNTFGDLLNATGDYYTVDFGEGVTVSLSEVMFMPRSTHASRLNGTIVSGSNDGENWTQITSPVNGAAANQWTQVKETELLDRGAYRYFKISDAAQGDIAEVEFYGSYTADPGLIAQKIVSLDDQLPSQTKMIYPSVPAGYTVSIKESGNEAVVALDGSINTPQNDTVVTLTLTVTHDESGESADTDPIDVVIKGIGSLFTRIVTPARGAAKLPLPVVPEGFTITVDSSSREDVIALGDGSIATPGYSTLVDVVLKLVRNSDDAVIYSDKNTVLIYGAAESEKIDVASVATVTASDNYDGCANIFDGNVDTFADANTNAAYTVDFGESGSVILDKIRIYPRSDSNDINAARTNGTQVFGSNNGTDWVEITGAVTGAKKFTWIDFTAEQFLAYGSFRYYKISGAVRGSMAEVEFYGERNVDGEAALEVAKAKVVNALEEYVIPQDQANTQEEAKKAVEDVIGTLNLSGATAEVITSEGKFVAAERGTADKPYGINGEYFFTVRLSLGPVVSITTEEMSVVIEAAKDSDSIFLTAPTNLSWDGKNAKFEASVPEENVAEYEISLYKDGKLVENSLKSIAADGSPAYSYYFDDWIQEGGNYTFKVTAKGDSSLTNIFDSEQAESSNKTYSPAEILKGRLIASFDFNDLTEDTTEITGAGAKAAVKGTPVYADSHDGSKAAALSGGFWLNVTKEDGTPLLAGADEITISYDNKLTGSNNQGWTFFAAPDTGTQVYKNEKYLGIIDKTSFTVERYLNSGSRPAVITKNGITSDWKHVDVVVTLNDFSLYIDGEHVATQPSSALLSDILTGSGGILQIGKANWGGGEYYSGLIDNIEIYSRSGSEDIDADMEAAKTAVVEALSGYTILQSDANTEEEVKAKVEDVLASLDLHEVNAEVVTASFAAAVEGTEEAADGTDGSYCYTVTLTKGDVTIDITDELSVIITASPYTSEPPAGDVTGGDVTGGDAGKDEPPAGDVTGGDAGEDEPPSGLPDGDAGEDEPPSGLPDGDADDLSDEDSGYIPPVEVDWNYVSYRLNQLISDRSRKADDDARNVDIAAGRNLIVPGNILERLRGSSLTAALHVGNQTALSISGENVTENMRGRNINLSLGEITADSKAVKRVTEGTITSREISIVNRDKFGMTVNLHFGLGTENADKYANLYRYSEQGKTFVCVGSFRITAEGQAMFGIVSGGDYLVTVTAKAARTEKS